MILASKTFGRTGRGSGLSDALEMAAQLLLELGIGNLLGIWGSRQNKASDSVESRLESLPFATFFRG
jgi:hypothetical protein